MGLYDHYIPDPPLKCPVCGVEINGWQGSDAACMLLTWLQGHKHPIRHDWPDECVEDHEEFLQSSILPPVFTFQTWNCACNRRIVAYGYCEDGVWVRSEFETHLNFRPGPTTSVHDEHRIKDELRRWLESKKM